MRPYEYISDFACCIQQRLSGHKPPLRQTCPHQARTGSQIYINDSNGDPIYNYAVARVRFVAPVGVDAVQVRMFFRLWTTGWTALEYDTVAQLPAHGNGSTATPLLGIVGGEVNNVPCFARRACANMDDTARPANGRTIAGADATEVMPTSAVGWTSTDSCRVPAPASRRRPVHAMARSISTAVQTLMRGLHQCLVAEIHYTLDPILTGATPRHERQPCPAQHSARRDRQSGRIRHAPGASHVRVEAHGVYRGSAAADDYARSESGSTAARSRSAGTR